MPHLPSILKRAHFTPDEINLAEEIERIIFDINIKTCGGKNRIDATFKDVKSGLQHRSIELPDETVLNLMNKLQWVKIEGEDIALPVLQEIRGKWRSNM